MGLVLTQLPLPTLLPLSMLRLSVAEAFAGLFLSGVSTHTVARRFTASGFVMRDQCILVIPRQPGREYRRNMDTDGRPTTNHLGRTTMIIRDLRPRSDVSTIISLIRFHLFDHLVGAGKQLARHREAERLCCRQVYGEFVFAWGLYREISGFLAA